MTNILNFDYHNTITIIVETLSSKQHEQHPLYHNPHIPKSLAGSTSNMQGLHWIPSYRWDKALATDHILMQPKLSLRQWSPKHVYTSVGLQTLSKEIQRIQMRHFAVIQHIYLLSLSSIEELKEACDSMLSSKVRVFSKTTSSTP